MADRCGLAMVIGVRQTYEQVHQLNTSATQPAIKRQRLIACGCRSPSRPRWSLAQTAKEKRHDNHRTFNLMEEIKRRMAAPTPPTTSRAI